MKMFSHTPTARRTVAGLVVFAVLVFASAGSAEAKYVDRSGELPGIESGSTLIWTAVAAGGLTAAWLLLSKRSNDDDDRASSTETDESGAPKALPLANVTVTAPTSSKSGLQVQTVQGDDGLELVVRFSRKDSGSPRLQLGN